MYITKKQGMWLHKDTSHMAQDSMLCLPMKMDSLITAAAQAALPFLQDLEGYSSSQNHQRMAVSNA